jgi:hypothetical protein
MCNQRPVTWAGSRAGSHAPECLSLVMSLVFWSFHFFAYVSSPIHPLYFPTSLLFLISHVYFFTLLSLSLYISPSWFSISLCNPPLSLSASHLSASSRSLFLLILCLNLFSYSISPLLSLPLLSVSHLNILFLSMFLLFCSLQFSLFPRSLFLPVILFFLYHSL